MNVFGFEVNRPQRITDAATEPSSRRRWLWLLLGLVVGLIVGGASGYLKGWRNGYDGVGKANFDGVWQVFGSVLYVILGILVIVLFLGVIWGIVHEFEKHNKVKTAFCVFVLSVLALFGGWHWLATTFGFAVPVLILILAMLALAAYGVRANSRRNRDELGSTN